MVPSDFFVTLDKLPLSVTGKFDRRPLPAPDLGSPAGHEFEIPAGKMEQTLSGLWQYVLKVEK